MKIGIKQSFPCEFGVSLEILQTLSKLGPNSQGHVCLMNFLFFLILSFFFKKKQKTKWVWRISKLSPNSKKICVHNFFWPFLDRLHAYFSWKKSCARISFFEFGESLERVWRFSKLILFLFFFAKKWNLKENSKNWHQANMSLWVWAEFGESLENLQTHSTLTGKCLFDVNFHFFWLFVCKKNENRMSLENLQNLSKLSPNSKKNMSAQTFFAFSMDWLHAYVSWKKSARIFFWVWREFGDSPNSFCFRFFVTKKIPK